MFETRHFVTRHDTQSKRAPGRTMYCLAAHERSHAVGLRAKRPVLLTGKDFHSPLTCLHRNDADVPYISNYALRTCLMSSKCFVSRKRTATSHSHAKMALLGPQIVHVETGADILDLLSEESWEKWKAQAEKFRKAEKDSAKPSKSFFSIFRCGRIRSFAHFFARSPQRCRTIFSLLFLVVFGV